MAENNETKSKREAFSERLKTKYPDRDYADDEALFGQVNDDYDDYENQISGYREREGKLEEMLSRDPRSAKFITDMAKGVDPWIAVIERVGSDGVIELMNDPEKKAAYEEANKKYVERVAEEERLEEEYAQNLAESKRLRADLDKQYGKALVDAALGVIDQMTKDALMGKITPEVFDIALKMVNRDSDIENARSEGEIAGRNARIEENLRERQSGDGIPAMGGSASAPVTKKKGFFDDIPTRKF